MELAFLHLVMTVSLFWNFFSTDDIIAAEVFINEVQTTAISKTYNPCTLYDEQDNLCKYCKICVSVFNSKSSLRLYSNHMNTKHLNTGFIWTPDSIGVWYANVKVKWLRRLFEYGTFWTINSIFFSPVFWPPFEYQGSILPTKKFSEFWQNSQNSDNFHRFSKYTQLLNQLCWGIRWSLRPFI